MKCYCTLHLNFNKLADLERVIKSSFISEGNFSDNFSPAEVERARKYSDLGLIVKRPHRFFWSISSLHIDFSIDLKHHISWLLACVNDGVHFRDFKSADFEVGLALYWGGDGGSGGGPLVTHEVAKILSDEGLDLGICFYQMG